MAHIHFRVGMEKAVPFLHHLFGAHDRLADFTNKGLDAGCDVLASGQCGQELTTVKAVPSRDAAGSDRWLQGSGSARVRSPANELHTLAT